MLLKNEQPEQAEGRKRTPRTPSPLCSFAAVPHPFRFYSLLGRVTHQHQPTPENGTATKLVLSYREAPLYMLDDSSRAL